MAYARAHVILVGYSVDNPDSLENVVTKWVEEARERAPPSTPIILVGLKKDLRDDPAAIEEMRRKSQNFVQPSYGESIARQVGAKRYLECSALTGEGVDDVFEAATRAALTTDVEGRGAGCCVIL